jgi:ribose 5-phosphate isomerase B
VVSESDAELSREHNDANVLTLGARITGDEEAFKIIDKWLATPFAGGRHGRRVDKIMAIEREEETKSSPA